MKDIEKYIEEVINTTNLINSEEIPNIDLYMDQVTTFLTSRLVNGNNEDDEPVFTKTMINNYAKSQLLPSPEKKKYSKDHILTLINIYFLKNVMSINNIQKLLNPVKEEFFHNNKDFNLETVYNEILSSIETVKTASKNDMLDKLKISDEAFKNAPKDQQEYLQFYSYISLLSFDVFLKKQLIEALIDTIETPEDEPTPEKEKPQSKSKEKKEKKS